MRSGSWSPPLPVTSASLFSLGVEESVSVSSSALSWISPRPITPMVSEAEREKGGGAVGDKILDGEVGMRIGSIDRNEDGEAGLRPSAYQLALVGLRDNPVSRVKSDLSPTVGMRVWISSEGGLEGLQCLRSKTGESMTASQSSQ
jgi:hypothetical protein